MPTRSALVARLAAIDMLAGTSTTSSRTRPTARDWKRDKLAVIKEHERGAGGRFGAGLPRISDSQLLFLQHLLAHMRSPEDGGSRVAIIMSASPMFTGDAGSGESEIRRCILENDWLETLIALPEHLFYNTGIATYVWVLSNRKAFERVGKVQLIDATRFWAKMRKSVSAKRRELYDANVTKVVGIRESFEESDFCAIRPSTHFGYQKVTIEYDIATDRISQHARDRETVCVPTFGRAAKVRRATDLPIQGEDHDHFEPQAC